jgi:hypothetical protein
LDEWTWSERPGKVVDDPTDSEDKMDVAERRRATTAAEE